MACVGRGVDSGVWILGCGFSDSGVGETMQHQESNPGPWSCWTCGPQFEVCNFFHCLVAIFYELKETWEIKLNNSFFNPASGE